VRFTATARFRELELTDKDAIVHRRIDKKDEYAVIEWNGDGLTVRSSSTDAEIARALAVAGLHEIEELVADEISPLPTDRPGEARPASSGAVGEGLAVRTGFGPAKAVPPPTSPSGHGAGLAKAGGLVAGPSRTLVLVFKTRIAGLSFQAEWLSRNRKGRVPALGPDAHSDGSAHVSTSERAKLIGLAAYARKAHFHYDQETGVYIMESLVEIPNFLKTVLPVWRRLFSIELDEKAANLLKGTRTIELEAVAERAAGGPKAPGRSEGPALNLRWIFRAGERLLTDGEVRSLLKRNGEPVILPNLGIVTLPADKWASFTTWQKNVEDTHGGDAAALSPYLIFSLFSDSRLKLTLSPEIEAWRQSVLSPPPSPPVLPELLRPYQRRGVEWMYHLADVGCHGLLADEMGLGKTMQVLALLASRPVAGKPSLIVCPASVVPVWREEIAKFFRPSRSISSRPDTTSPSVPMRSCGSRATRSSANTGSFWAGSNSLTPCSTRASSSRTRMRRSPRRALRCGRSTAWSSPARRWRTGSSICGASSVSSCPACSARGRRSSRP
jgi:hypothetical protein